MQQVFTAISGGTWWTSNDSVWPPAATGAANSSPDFVIAWFQIGNYSRSVASIRFDTSALPEGASITAATLTLWIEDINSPDAVQLTAGYHDCGAEITIDDYVYPHENDAIGGIDLTAFTATQYKQVPLINVSNISTSGVTGLRMHPKIDSAPAGANWLYWGNGAGYAEEFWPTLTVEYAQPGGSAIRRVRKTRRISW